MSLQPLQLVLSEHRLSGIQIELALAVTQLTVARQGFDQLIMELHVALVLLHQRRDHRLVGQAEEVALHRQVRPA